MISADYVCDSDTLTDVSSLHDLDNDDDVDDDTTSQCTRVVTDDHCTSPDTADNLSDLTIPDFAVSLILINHFCFRQSCLLCT